MHAVSVLNIGL